MSPEYYEVGPGFPAFVVSFALAVTIWLIYRSMSKKLRRQKLEERRLQEEAEATRAAAAAKKADALGAAIVGDAGNSAPADADAGAEGESGGPAAS